MRNDKGDDTYLAPVKLAKIGVSPLYSGYYFVKSIRYRPIPECGRGPREGVGRARHARASWTPPKAASARRGTPPKPWRVQPIPT